MFAIECFLYLLLVFYSLIYQIRSIMMYRKNKKVAIKNASGLFVAKDVLNDNKLSTLYITKIEGKHNDHYDIERNVIRLSEEVYNEENLSSLVIGFYQSIKAIYFNEIKKKKEEKIKHLIMDYANKAAFILFIISAASKAIDMMTLSIIIMLVVVIIKYTYINKKIEIFNKNISLVKKEYKLKKENIEELEKYMKILVNNDLSLHILNNNY